MKKVLRALYLATFCLPLLILFPVVPTINNTQPTTAISLIIIAAQLFILYLAWTELNEQVSVKHVIQKEWRAFRQDPITWLRQPVPPLTYFIPLIFPLFIILRCTIGLRAFTLSCRFCTIDLNYNAAFHIFWLSVVIMRAPMTLIRFLSTTHSKE